MADKKHLQMRVLPIVRYKDTAELLRKLPNSVIGKAENKAKRQAPGVAATGESDSGGNAGI